MVDKTQGVESSVILVTYLLDETSIQKYFKNNLFVGEQNIKQEKVRNLIENKKLIYKVNTTMTNCCHK